MKIARIAIALMLVCVLGNTARAGLVAGWMLDGNSDMYRATDYTSGVWDTLAAGTPDGTVNYVPDSVLGREVLSLTGAGMINFGSFPTIYNNATSGTSDFTYSCWVATNNNNSNVVLGNRNPNVDDHYNFTKIKTNGFEWATTAANGVSSKLPMNWGWSLCTVTKTGDTISYYVNGAHKGNISQGGDANQVMSPYLFTVGGDWSGKTEYSTCKVSDIQVYNTGMTAFQVNQLNAFQRSSAVAGILQNTPGVVLYNTFDNGIGDKWTVTNKGFQADDTNNTYSAGTNDYGQLVITGTQPDTTAWRGATVFSNEKFSTANGNEILFTASRVSLEKNAKSSGSRTSLILRDGSGHYVQLAQNTELLGGMSWSFNVNATGNGTLINKDTDYNQHEVSIKVDGTNAYFYVDGGLYMMSGSTITEFQCGLMGTARYPADEITATFDNAAVYNRSTLTLPTPIAPITDTFASGTLDDSRWISTGNVLDRFNVVQLATNSTLTLNEIMPYTGAEDFAVRVDRDSMMQTGGTSGGISLVSLDGGAMLTLKQTGSGIGPTGMWSFSWDGVDITYDGATSATGSVDLFVNDVFEHQLLLESLHGETDTLKVSIDTNQYEFVMDGFDDLFTVQLFASSGSAYSGFNNFGITGAQVPEPATWGLLLLSLGGLFLLRRKQGRRAN